MSTPTNPAGGPPERQLPVRQSGGEVGERQPILAPWQVAALNFYNESLSQQPQQPQKMIARIGEFGQTQLVPNPHAVLGLPSPDEVRAALREARGHVVAGVNEQIALMAPTTQAMQREGAIAPRGPQTRWEALQQQLSNGVGILREAISRARNRANLLRDAIEERVGPAIGPIMDTFRQFSQIGVLLYQQRRQGADAAVGLFAKIEGALDLATITANRLLNGDAFDNAQRLVRHDTLANDPGFFAGTMRHFVSIMTHSQTELTGEVLARELIKKAAVAWLGIDNIADFEDAIRATLKGRRYERNLAILAGAIPGVRYSLLEPEMERYIATIGFGAANIAFDRMRANPQSPESILTARRFVELERELSVRPRRDMLSQREILERELGRLMFMGGGYREVEETVVVRRWPKKTEQRKTLVADMDRFSVDTLRHHSNYRPGDEFHFRAISQLFQTFYQARELLGLNTPALPPANKRK